MGFFSWTTSDTERSISNMYSTKGALPVYLLCPDGTKIHEQCYEGYGVFGGSDAYALLARWNAPNECNGDDDHDRLVGINLQCHRKSEVKFPLKFVEDGSLNYDEVDESEDCPMQGFFYEDEDEGEDEWEE
ncbi:hypothetical protein [Selenomonas ruminantium]|nr:hypothetical protein [Selenomonas ruminantium]